MKNIFYRIYTAAFVGICLVPAVLTPFIKTDSSKEKRELGELPSVKTADGNLNFNFFSEFETYFSEHFAFRQQLVNADGRLRSAAVKTSPNSDVIVGSDGWLYYGQTIGDYLRTDTLSRAEICETANNIRIMAQYCETKGADLIFFSAPNKNTLYPEHMPYNYVPADRESNLEMLTDEISEADYFFDMKKALLELQSPTPLYHKTDTHWNNFGAYAAHTMLMNKLGKPSCSDGSGWYTANDRLGDLAAMIYPAEDAKDMQLHNDYEFTYEYKSRFRGLDDMLIDTECKNAEGRLLMFRDSYGEAILPYMAEMYAEAEFSRVVPYRLTNVKEGDDVIIELVERNLKNLHKTAPVMEAPMCAVPDISAETISPEGAFLASEESSGMLHVYGYISEEYVPESPHGIIVEAGDKAYEAFTCFEEELIGEEGGIGGFSLYIPNEHINDKFKVTVIPADGTAVSVEFE